MPTPSAPGRSASTVSSSAPEPMPQIEHAARRRRGLERGGDGRLAVAARDQHAGRDHELAAVELLARRGCRRPARAVARRSTSAAKPAGAASACAAAAAPSASPRAHAPSAARHRAARCPTWPPAAAAASRSASATVVIRPAPRAAWPGPRRSARRSARPGPGPASTSASLCSVRPMRWSVTRPCGKL